RMAGHPHRRQLCLGRRLPGAAVRRRGLAHAPGPGLSGGAGDGRVPAGRAAMDGAAPHGAGHGLSGCAPANRCAHVERLRCRRARDGWSVPAHTKKENNVTLGTILLIVLVLLLLGVFPTWPHSRGWGYAPSGLLGVVLV